MNMDTPTLEQMRIDFEKTFRNMPLEKMHEAKNNPHKMCYKIFETELAWRGWVGGYLVMKLM